MDYDEANCYGPQMLRLLRRLLADAPYKPDEPQRFPAKQRFTVPKS